MALSGWKPGKKSFSASNLSSISNTSTTSTRILQNSFTVTLPVCNESFGAQVSADGRVRRILPNGPAHASSVIQVGDYVKVVSVSEAHQVTLLVTYAQIQVDAYPGGPFLLEIANPSKTALGLALTDTDDAGGGGQGSRWHREVAIASIQRGSLAERCGFLRPGDRITSIWGTEEGGERETIPCGLYTSFQLAQILRRLTSSAPSMTFTILPHRIPSMDCPLSLSTEFNWEDEAENPSNAGRLEEERGRAQSSSCILSLCLWKDSSFDDWGFSIVDPEEEEEGNSRGPAIVHEIRPGGPAFLVGLLPGDKILQINEREVSTYESTILVPILASLQDALNLIIFRP